MDVRLPNGRIISGVPDGTGQAEIAQKAIVAGIAKPSDFPNGDRIVKALQLEAEANNIPSPDPGAIRSALIGAGRTYNKIGAGAQNIYYGLTGNDDAQKALASDQAAQQKAYAQLQGKHPVATFIGELAPSLAVPAYGGAAGTAITGGLLSGLAYGDNQVQQGLTGAALSALPYGAGKALKRLSGPAAKEASKADILGYRLTPGERSGSDSLRKLEASLESFPLTAGAFAKIRGTNQKTINRTAARAIGENANNVSDDVLGRAAERISNQFDDLTKGRTIAVDDTFRNAIGAIDNDIAEGLFDSDIGVKALNRFRDKLADGQLTDEEYQKISSQISKKMRSKSIEWEDKDILAGIKHAMDDLVERSLGGKDLKAFRNARQQWKNLVLLEKPGVVNTATGDVSGRSLANALRRMDKTGYMRGENQSTLYNIARASQKYKPIVGDSGTATRSSVPFLLTSSLAGAGGVGLAGFPPALGLMLGAAAPLAARAYLHGGTGAIKASKTIAPYVLPALENRLIAPRLGLLSAGAVTSSQ